MTNNSTKGLVISTDNDKLKSATSLNIKRLNDSMKPIQFFDYINNQLRENKNSKLDKLIKKYISTSDKLKKDNYDMEILDLINQINKNSNKKIKSIDIPKNNYNYKINYKEV